MTLILTDICFNANTLLDKTDLDNNAVLTELLDLHQYHCGEAATCGSSEHVEPSEFRIPAPCCVPCSCLPSCVELQNCCPGSRNRTQTVPMTTSGLGSTVIENETIEADNGMILERKNLVTSIRTDENESELNEIDELHNGNSTDFDTKDSEVVKMDEIDRANKKCTRPQVFYRPNRYLDSSAYMMVTTCPEDKLSIDKCNAGMDNVELLDMIPVTSKLSGLTYKNKYCLICHEKLQPEHIIDWTAEIVSSGARRERVFLPSIETIKGNLMTAITTLSNMHFVPGDKSLTRPCKASDIISCNQTGLWDNYDELTETLCFHGYHLPIIHKIDKHPLTFKNIACLTCNTGRGMSENSLSCDYWEDPGQNRHQWGFSVTLNVKFQYSDRLIENNNPQKIRFSEVLRGTLPVLSWQPISLFISEHISSYSAYILINNCSLIWYRFCFQEMNTF